LFEEKHQMAFEPIENYGVIGNMESIALVGMNGSIDFLCYPDFDSPTVFAALLDDQRGGRFEIRPQIGDMRVRQLYFPDTNILLTRFLSEEGVAELTDYMPVQKNAGQANRIVRILSVIRGNVKFKMSCQPRFNYAASDHELQSSDRCATFFPAHKSCPPMSLYSTVAIERRLQDISAEFSLQAGESATFVLGGLQAEGEQPEMDLLRQRFLETAQFWKTWVSKSNYKGRWREMVLRSALVLKLLTSRKHGSLIAAATFSLPESIGGVRNWDYRFTWLRDAAFTLHALIRLGFLDETEAFFGWVKGRLGEDAQRGPIAGDVRGRWQTDTGRDFAGSSMWV
jgi:GH15 family glucan-1,4-alpha-glucosidase